MSAVTFKELTIDIAKAYYNKLFYPHFPLGMTIFLTDMCNLQCSFCEIGQQNTSQINDTPCTDLSKENIDTILQLCKTNRITRIYVTGGEPFLSGNIWYLLEQCIKHNIIVSDITTNGTFLQDLSEYEIDLISKSVRTIVVSIDDAHEAGHDFYRGINGTFQKINSFFIDNKKRARFKSDFSFNVVIHNKNINTLNDIIDLALSWRIHHINFQPVSPSVIIPEKTIHFDKDHYVKDLDIMNIKQKIKNAINHCKGKNISTNLKLFHLWAPYYFNYLNKDYLFFNYIPIKMICAKVINYIHINYNGNLIPCVNQKPFSNIRDEDFYHKWQENAHTLKKLFHNKHYFNECRYCYCDFPINFRLSLAYFPIKNIRYAILFAGYYLKRIMRQ